MTLYSCVARTEYMSHLVYFSVPIFSALLLRRFDLNIFWFNFIYFFT